MKWRDHDLGIKVRPPGTIAFLCCHELVEGSERDVERRGNTRHDGTFLSNGCVGFVRRKIAAFARYILEESRKTYTSPVITFACQ